MRLVHVAAAVVNQTPLDWAGNRKHILSAMEEARAENVQVLCLPELAITGYACEDAFLGMGVDQRALEELAIIEAHSSDLLVCVGLPLRWHGALYNVLAIIVDGQLCGFYAKQHLAGDGLHYEPRWFQAWPAGQQVQIEWQGRSVPLGDLFVDCGGLRIAFEICEDAWVPNRSALDKAPFAIDIVLNPSASHFAFHKYQRRLDIVREGSRALQCAYVYTNLVGNESGRIIFDGGASIARNGDLIAQGPRFVLDDVHVTSAVIDIDQARLKQAAMTSFHTEAVESELCVQVAWEMPTGTLQAAVVHEQWERSEQLQYEEFTRAIALGLIDYVRKSMNKGFVISLSGGADSAAVAVLVRIAWNWGLKHFGDGQWQQRLGLATEAVFADWCHCVYQATKQSGSVTQDAAQKLAQTLEADFHIIEVEDITQAYRLRVETMLGRELNWEKDDIALQNIQARVRAPSVWMLANCLQCLLLATSNRSEAAVGYATMDGDTCGGLSPIAGIDKAFLLAWLRWMERDGGAIAEALPILHVINRQVPTAELRPQVAAQNDEADLMPYPILDAIERLAIRDKYSPQECMRFMLHQFPEISETDMHEMLKRFFTLWSRNQWKRERYAPSFHVDDENLDPKTWCRFPILSGGFRHELEAL